MTFKTLPFCLFFFTTNLTAQPTIQWQKTYGGSLFDEPNCIVRTKDGGCITAGLSSSYELFGHHGGLDILVIKFSSSGEIQWKRFYGGSANEVSQAIGETYDGGYYLAGYSKSTDYDMSVNHGGYDVWFAKLDSLGNIIWQKSFGGSERDDLFDAQQTSDHGFILACSTASTNGDITYNHGYYDYWVIKLSENGTMEWQKTYGGSDYDVVNGIKQTADGGYVVVGETSSNDGDVTEPKGNTDFWVVKLSPTGVLQWQKALGGQNSDVAEDIIQTEDGGYVVVGYQGSVVGEDILVHYGLYDYWVIKLDSLGSLQWQFTYGGSEPDYGRDIVESDDGGYVIVGGVQSTDGNVVGNDGGGDIGIIKLSPEGELLWQKTIGGSLGEEGYGIDRAQDGGYYICGIAWSDDLDLTGAHPQGKDDVWVVKLSPESLAAPEPSVGNSISLFPNPATAGEQISIRLPGDLHAATEWSLRDATGRLWASGLLEEKGDLRVQAPRLPGFYFLELTNGVKRFQGKIIVEN